MSDQSGDAVLVRRAARRIALQVAAVVGAAMLALLVVLMAVVIRGENGTADSLLRRTAALADDVGDPPPDTWIVFREATSVRSSAGLPASLLPVLAAQAAQTSTRPQLMSHSVGDAHFRILTEHRNGHTVQVVLDRVTQARERRHLVRAAAVVAVAGLLAAAGIGLVAGRRAVRPLAAALGLQRRFVADAGHELRTPLTLLSTRAQLVERELQAGGPDANLMEDVHDLVNDVRRLGDVVEDLLVAADPRQAQPRTEVDLAALVEQVMSSTAAHAQAKGVVLQRGTAGPAKVLGTEAALRRALLALVDNAIDHTPSGGRVELSIRQSRAEVIVSVTDTGPGVAPADAAKIFDRFSSGGQRAGRTHYGLGLALTHDVINRHGGRLRLLPPAAGAGATFEITVPAARR